MPREGTGQESGRSSGSPIPSEGAGAAAQRHKEDPRIWPVRYAAAGSTGTVTELCLGGEHSPPVLSSGRAPPVETPASHSEPYGGEGKHRSADGQLRAAGRPKTAAADPPSPHTAPDSDLSTVHQGGPAPARGSTRGRTGSTVADIYSPGALQKSDALRARRLRRAAGKVRRCGVEPEDPDRDKALFARAAVIAALSYSGVILNTLLLWHTGSLADSDEWGTSRKQATLAGQVAVSLLTFLALGAVVEYHLTAFAYERSFSPGVGFVSGRGESHRDWTKRGRLVPLALELLLNAPHSPPYYAHHRFSINLACFMFLRVYTLARVVGLASPAVKHRFDIFSQEKLHGSFHNMYVSWITGVKLFFLSNTTWTFTICYVLAWLSCAFSVYFAEREEQPDRISNIGDSMWFTFVTFTTIGYGDIFPVTSLGRCAVVVGGILGLILANLFTAVCTVKFSPSEPEREMLSFEARRNCSRRRFTEAVRLLQSFWRDCLACKRKPARGAAAGFDISSYTRHRALKARAARKDLENSTGKEFDRDFTAQSILKQTQRNARLMKRVMASLNEARVWLQMSPQVLPPSALPRTPPSGLRPGSPAGSQLQRSPTNSAYDSARGQQRLTAPSGMSFSRPTEALLRDLVSELQRPRRQHAAGAASAPALPPAAQSPALPPPRDAGDAVAEERHAWLENKLEAVLCTLRDHSAALAELQGPAPERSGVLPPGEPRDSGLLQRMETLAEERHAWLETKLEAILCNQRDQIASLAALEQRVSAMEETARR